MKPEEVAALQAKQRLRRRDGIGFVRHRQGRAHATVPRLPGPPSASRIAWGVWVTLEKALVLFS